MTYFQVNRKLLLMKIHFFLGIGGNAFGPFLTIISKQRGYSAFIVGLIFMLQPIPGMLMRPIVGAVTDKYKCRRSVFIANSIIMFVLVCLLSIIPGTTSKEEMNDLDVIKSPLFWMFCTITILIRMVGMVNMVLEDTICMDLLEDKNNYGKQRLWGSIGWSLFAIIYGTCVDWYSTGLDYKNYTPGYVIAMLCFLLDTYVVCNLKIVQANDTKIVASDVKKVFTEGKVLAFLLWVVFIGFFMSFIWNFVFWYLEDLSNEFHPETKSWMKTLQGTALLIQCFGGEVPSFLFSSYILKRVDHMTVLSAVFFTFTCIFSLYTIIENPLWALPVELLNGITFAMSYSAAISYAALIAPAGAEGTLQGVVGTAYMGIGAPIGSIVGGYMFKHIGSIATFKLLSVVAFFTCAVQIIVNYILRRLSKNDDINSNVQTKDDNIKEDIHLT
ncbi:major facilitator superfamily domain-containing protein 6-A isoform X2 [Acyrthosiphon pisum]|uniref:Major facilitator superfamily associated domain-containing protein n=1 Tax=Acyrthosiphon pisum TaxID=7029 RepID=A0A8R2H6U8_ACYPI|nr:major facilitator superfamily domain-containing protein 6-A isoform X2 [Acyrthosiphon pisum]|eukprot:XP_016658375.1 PREDICTED: major facilitator superfamily domain-containing protein 6-A-like isoform X2 [Acyrthosiphon pisum]